MPSLSIRKNVANAAKHFTSGSCLHSMQRLMGETLKGVGCEMRMNEEGEKEKQTQIQTRMNRNAHERSKTRSHT